MVSGEAQPPTKVFAKAGRNIGAIGCMQASAVVPADIYKFDFLLLTSTLYFQLAFVPGWTSNEFHAFQILNVVGNAIETNNHNNISDYWDTNCTCM